MLGTLGILNVDLGQKIKLSQTFNDTWFLSNMDWEKPPRGKTHAKCLYCFIAFQIVRGLQS
jgi:hypothetical protein